MQSKKEKKCSAQRKKQQHTVVAFRTAEGERLIGSVHLFLAIVNALRSDVSRWRAGKGERYIRAGHGCIKRRATQRSRVSKGKQQKGKPAVNRNLFAVLGKRVLQCWCHTGACAALCANVLTVVNNPKVAVEGIAICALEVKVLCGRCINDL